MAKLNEVPPPAPETVESLKRKYIRQNREIVRTNTAQSARIRNLECEVTRLLNENLVLREEAISARADADKWKAAHKLTKEVWRMKEQLESKLSEVSELVGELGSLPEKVARRSSQRRRREGFVSELVKSPESQEPRHRQTLLEQEGRLPAIIEDKYYPRRTIEALELTNIKTEELDGDLESPDIGPPPVAHFDEPESVTFNASRSPRRTSTELVAECESANKPTTNNVETRRKRRTSTLLQEPTADEAVYRDTITVKPKSIVREVEDVPKHVPQTQPQSILKKGAKRKLEVSELEDTSNNVAKELDDFIFQRRPASTTTLSRPSRFTRPVARLSEPVPALKKEPEQDIDTSRKALATKTTNSPAKRRVISSEKSTPSDAEKAKPQVERRIVSRVRSRPNVPQPNTNSNIATASSRKSISAELEHRAKTPAADLEDLLSPMSSEKPETKSRSSKEAALSSSVEDVLNGSIGRGSRRARASVSYAEPNLRDKMRRPGKELVGAVDGLEVQRRSSHSAEQSQNTRLSSHRTSSEVLRSVFDPLSSPIK